MLKNICKMLFLLFFLGALCCSQVEAKQHSLHSKKWEFAAMTMFQNEAPYLKEWIEFHKLVGAEHFYMINHLSTDNYLEVLQPYIEKGEVELIEWTEKPKSEIDFNQIQVHAYEHCRKLARGKVTWLAILDSDEFVFTKNGQKIQDYLRPILEKKDLKTSVGGVLVYWLMFGTSNVPYIPKGKTMIELLTKAAPNIHHHPKTICRPDCVTLVENPHYCRYNSGYKAHSKIGEILGDNLQLNHYWTRDEDFFYNHKIPRRKTWGLGADTCLQWAAAMNKVPNTAIQRYVPALRKNMGFKQQVPAKSGT